VLKSDHSSYFMNFLLIIVLAILMKFVAEENASKQVVLVFLEYQVPVHQINPGAKLQLTLVRIQLGKTSAREKLCVVNAVLQDKSAVMVHVNVLLDNFSVMQNVVQLDKFVLMVLVSVQQMKQHVVKRAVLVDKPVLMVHAAPTVKYVMVAAVVHLEPVAVSTLILVCLRRLLVRVQLAKLSVVVSAALELVQLVKV